MLQTRGIDKVIATPHFIGDYDSKVTPESVKEKIDILNKEMKKNNISSWRYIPEWRFLHPTILLTGWKKGKF